MLLVGGLPARHIFVQEEGAIRFGIILIFSKNGYGVGDMRVGNKAFSSVKDEIITILFIRGADAGGIRPAGSFRYSGG